MRAYRTMVMVDLYCGRVGLSRTQADARARNLRQVSDGVYEIVNPVQFKAGEIIRLDDPEKIILGRLECLESAPCADEIAPSPHEPELVKDEPRKQKRRYKKK